MEQNELGVSSYITTVGTAVCGICATIDLAILLVYVLLWDKHSLYGWSIMAMVASLFTNSVLSALLPGLTSKLATAQNAEVLMSIANHCSGKLL